MTFPSPSRDLPLPQQIAGHIRTQIIHDELKPGERIRERELAEQLEVSRTPLRDALKILSNERLVDLHPNRGAVVVSLTDTEVAEMLTVYTDLDVLGGRLACRHGSDADFFRVKHYAGLMRQAFETEDRLSHFTANQGFHLSIAAASNNRTLIDIHAQLNLRLYRTRYLAVMNSNVRLEALDHHDQMIEALMTRNADALAHLQQEHLALAWRLITPWAAPAGLHTLSIPPAPRGGKSGA